MANEKSRSRGDARGFTLLELVLVVVVLSILAGLVVPQMAGSFPGVRVGKAAERVFAAAREARAHAALRGLRTRLILDTDPAPQQFWLEEERSPLTAPGVWTELADREDRHDELPDGVAFVGVRVWDEDLPGSGRHEILFKPDGSADDTRIALAADSGEQRVVDIRGVTGRVRILTDEEAAEETSKAQRPRSPR